MIYPKTFSIETFLGCNARCTMCSVNDWEREHGLMKFDLYEKIISEVKTFKDEVYQFALFLDGEPLLDNLLHKRIELAKKAQINNVGFTTNAYLFNKDDRINKILDSEPDWIVISFDSLIKEHYEKIRLRLQYERVLDNIHELIKQRNSKNKKTTICVRYIEQDLNKLQFDDYKNYFSKILNNDLDEIHYAKEHNWGVGNGVKIGATRCHFIYNRFVIMRDGKVPLCCIDFNAEELMGNIKNESILEIFNSKKWNIMRNMHSNNERKKIEICKNCNIPDLDNDKSLSKKLRPDGSTIWSHGSLPFKKS